MFKKAERKQVDVKLAVTGPSGAGKTYSALLLASGLGKKIALIDTENDSSQLYAGMPGIPNFDTLTISAPFLSSKYIAAIKGAIAGGYDVLIIDSISHQWNSEGGIMDRMDKEKLAKPSLNSYTLWAKYTPEHEAFKQAIVQAPLHIISTIRSKQDYVLQSNDKGKQQPQKVGMAPVQRDQFEYEFTTVFDISMEHYASVSKDRTGLFDGEMFKITPEIGSRLVKWLQGGISGQPVRPNNSTVQPPPGNSGPPDDGDPGPTEPPDHFPEDEYGTAPTDNPDLPVQETSSKPPAPPANPKKWQPTEPQLKRLFALTKKASWSNEQLQKYLKANMNVTVTKDLNKDQYNLITKYLDEKYTFDKAMNSPTIYQ